MQAMQRKGREPEAALAGLVVPTAERVAPLYHQLKETLTQQILSGRWKPGDELPSEFALCTHFAVSRGTLRRALADLALQGLVERRQGRGSFVAAAKFAGNVLASYAFYRAGAIGHDARAKVLKVARAAASEELRLLLGLGAGEEVYEVQRIQSMRRVPITLAVSWVPASLCPGLERRDLRRRHLNDVMEQDFGVTLLRAEELLEPVLADEYVAGLLQIAPGTPVFLVERRSRGAGERILELRRSHMRGDRYQYRIDLR